jgi:hypothetical protein
LSELSERLRRQGSPIPAVLITGRHRRVAIVGGTMLVALVNVYLFRDVQALSQPEKALVYQGMSTCVLLGFPVMHQVTKCSQLFKTG